MLRSTCLGLGDDLPLCPTGTQFYITGWSLNSMVFPVLIFFCIHLVNMIAVGGQDEF